MSKKKQQHQPKSQCLFCGTVNRKSKTAVLHGSVNIGDRTLCKYIQRCTRCGKPVFIAEKEKQ